MSGGSVEHINAGSLQRIADATEKIAVNYDELVRVRNYWQKRAEDEEKTRKERERTIIAMKGVTTKLERKIADLARQLEESIEREKAGQGTTVHSA